MVDNSKIYAYEYADTEKHAVYTNNGYSDYDALFRDDKNMSHICAIYLPSTFISRSEHLTLKRKARNLKEEALMLTVSLPPHCCPPALYGGTVIHVIQNKIGDIVIVIVSGRQVSVVTLDFEPKQSKTPIKEVVKWVYLGESF